jgi:hypothetical protein
MASDGGVIRLGPSVSIGYRQHETLHLGDAHPGGATPGRCTRTTPRLAKFPDYRQKQVRHSAAASAAGCSWPG